MAPFSGKGGSVAFLAAVVLLTVGAMAVRLPRLAQRPMHPDEANQAVRTGILWETGVYRYDPHEHHGPSLYWFTLPSLWLRGQGSFAESDEITFRLVPLVFGVGLILLLPLVADGLGRGACLAAGVLLGVSPAMVYFSRYYIQEMLLVFFTFATIGCAWRWLRSGTLWWAIAAGLCIGMMHATKETWVLAGAAAFGGVILTILWTGWRDGVTAWPGQRPFRAGLVAATVALLVAAAWYSSFGANWRGPLDSVLAYATYWRRGSEGGAHGHPWYYYLRLLLAHRPARGFFWTEGFLFFLGVVGSVVCLGRKASRCADAGSEQPLSADSPPSVSPSDGVLLGRFLAFYTILLIAVYSAISYKTPWCCLSFLHGVILLSGVGAAWLLAKAPGWWGKTLVALLLLAGVGHLGRETYWLAFRMPADTRNPYVYAHSSTDVLNLASKLDQLAAGPNGPSLVVHVISAEDYWPLPWYLRRFDPNRVGYWQDATAWWTETHRNPPPSVILFSSKLQDQIDDHFATGYKPAGTFGLRPEVLVCVYVRDDL